MDSSTPSPTIFHRAASRWKGSARFPTRKSASPGGNSSKVKIPLSTPPWDGSKNRNREVLNMNRSLRPRTMKIGLALAFAGVLAAADLPKGETLLDKYIEVTGGKAAYSKMHSQMMTGTMEFPAMGLKGKMTIYSAEPDKQYFEINLEGVGKMQEGSSGDIAWANSAMQGPRIKEGGEKTESLMRDKFNADLNQPRRRRQDAGGIQWRYRLG